MGKRRSSTPSLAMPRANQPGKGVLTKDERRHFQAEAKGYSDAALTARAREQQRTLEETRGLMRHSTGDMRRTMERSVAAQEEIAGIYAAEAKSRGLPSATEEVQTERAARSARLQAESQRIAGEYQQVRARNQQAARLQLRAERLENWGDLHYGHPLHSAARARAEALHEQAKALREESNKAMVRIRDAEAKLSAEEGAAARRGVTLAMPRVTPTRRQAPSIAGLHATSQSYRRTEGLRREAKPGTELRPIRDLTEIHRSEMPPRIASLIEELPPYLRSDNAHIGGILNREGTQAEKIHMDRLVFGDHQVGNILSQMTPGTLREIARDTGFRGSLGTQKGEMVSRLTAHLTNGRYSAEFEVGTKTKAKSASSRTKAAPKTSTGGKAPKPKETPEAKRTRLQGTLSRIDRELAAHNKAMRQMGTDRTETTRTIQRLTKERENAARQLRTLETPAETVARLRAEAANHEKESQRDLNAISRLNGMKTAPYSPERALASAIGHDAMHHGMEAGQKNALADTIERRQSKSAATGATARTEVKPTPEDQAIKSDINIASTQRRPRQQTEVQPAPTRSRGPKTSVARVEALYSHLSVAPRPDSQLRNIESRTPRAIWNALGQSASTVRAALREEPSGTLTNLAHDLFSTYGRGLASRGVTEPPFGRQGERLSRYSARAQRGIAADYVANLITQEMLRQQQTGERR